MESDEYEVVERGTGGRQKAYTHSITKFTAWLLKACVEPHLPCIFPLTIPLVLYRQTDRHSGNIKRVQEMKSRRTEK
jgi:hypothetical protein